MSFLVDLAYVLSLMVSIPGIMILLFVVIFTGPSPLDGLPDPLDGVSDKKGEDSLKEE